MLSLDGPLRLGMPCTSTFAKDMLFVPDWAFGVMAITWPRRDPAPGYLRTLGYYIDMFES